MFGKPFSLALAAIIYIVFAPVVHAQQFGGALAITDSEILVSETGNRAFSGEIYTYSMDENGAWQATARIKPADGSEGDGFGSAMATEGAILVVGASGYAEESGKVYIYERDASGWKETAQISGQNAIPGEVFGKHVSLDEGRVFVAATGYNNERGGVFVFERDEAGAWSQKTVLTASDGIEGDHFGARISVDAGTLLVSAPDHQKGAGAVYSFRLNQQSGTWEESGKLTAGGDGARFGGAVVLNDGVAFVAATRYANRQGAVFVFNELDGKWVQQHKLTPFDGERFIGFGSALHVGEDQLWVGATGTNNRIGGIYVFNGSAASGWNEVEKLGTSSYAPRAAFASTLVVKDDLAVVGALGVDNREGAALILQRNAASQKWEEKESVVNEMKGYKAVLGEEVPCSEKEAAGFPCEGISMTSFLPLQQMGGSRGVRVNDIWGWVDPVTGKEYALVGRTDGTSFVDVSDPLFPVYIGDLPKTPGSRSSVWRDIKVYQDHAYVVADGAGQHGMQVLDLSILRTVDQPPVTFSPTVYYGDIASAHNIVINEDTGYAYAVGSSSGGVTCGGGLHMIDIREPQRPTFIGCFADVTTGRRNTGYTHDAQCVIYSGPDTPYQGKEICFGSNETALSIADVTDKKHPVAISMASYPKVAYTHQGWLTEDQRYFYMNDEGDEVNNLVEGTRTLVWDVQDLDDPVLVKEHIATTTSIDHNLYIRGNLMYQSNYDAGLRIFDVSDPVNPVEIGYFDTTPYVGGGGSWSNYPYFDSGTIIVTSRSEGLFLLKKEDISF